MHDLSALPFWTAGCLAVALGATVGVLCIGVIRLLQWRKGARELKAVRRDMEAEHGGKGHRHLHRTFDEVTGDLRQQAKGRRLALRVVDALLEPVTLLHDRQVLGAAGQWEDVRDPFLDRVRWPIRLTRGASGWVVLIGLAGTVLGFSQAVPALRAILTEGNRPAVEASQGARPEVGEVGLGDERDAEENRGAERLSRVLNEVRGVFYATFGGVLGALLLSFFSVVALEPAFDRYSDEVDRLGARWLVPLIHPPDTLVDDALRSELKSYFDEIGRGLEGQLSPLVRGLTISLEKLSGSSDDLQANIAAGRDTLRTFHHAVEELGSVAGGAVGELKGIVTIAQDFLRETRDLQDAGRQQLDSLATALGEPVNALAAAATAIDEKVGGLDDHLFGLDTATRSITQAIHDHRDGEEALKLEVGRAAAALERSLEVDSQSSAAAGAAAVRLEEVAGSWRELGERLESSTREASERFLEAHAALAGPIQEVARTSSAAEKNLQALANEVPKLARFAAELTQKLAQQDELGKEVRAALETTVREIAGQSKTVTETLQALAPAEASATPAVEARLLEALDRLDRTLSRVASALGSEGERSRAARTRRRGASTVSKGPRALVRSRSWQRLKGVLKGMFSVG